MQSSAFTAWKDGSTPIAISCGREDGQPFVVTAEGEHWIPMNIIVFACDGDDAIALVHEAFQKCIEIDYNEGPKANPGLTKPSDKYVRIKELEWTVKPYMKSYAAKVQWASNDGVVT